MKRIMTSHRKYAHGAAALASCVLLLACTEDMARDLFEERTAVEVNATVEDLAMRFGTRTANVSLNNGSFTLSGSSDNNRVYVNIRGDEHVYTISGTGNSTTFAEDETTYFQKDETSVDVYGHYPYAAGFTTVDGQQYFTIQKNQTTDDGYLMSDLMTADNAPARRTKQGNGTWKDEQSANLEFKHQMAKIIVNVSTDESGKGSGLTIKKVELVNVKPRVPISYSGGKYTIGEATTDASGESYSLTLMTNPVGNSGEATALIPSQRFNVAAADVNDPQKKIDFIRVIADFTNPNIDNATKQENLEFTYYFKGNGKLFKPGHVYNVKLVLGVRDPNLIDEYNVRGVELAKWAADEDATDVEVFAAEEKMQIVAEKIDVAVAATAATKVFTGEPLTLQSGELTVKLNDQDNPLVEGDDYELHYASNVNVGEAIVTIMGIGRYAGTLEAKFNITPKNIADGIKNGTITVELENENPTYDGSAHEPSLVIKDTEREEDGIPVQLTRYDFSTTWTNNTNVGNAKVTITGIGNYEGTTETPLEFAINKDKGSIAFDDAYDTSQSTPTLKLIMPKGHDFEYDDGLNNDKQVGDGKLLSITSSDESVLKIESTDLTNKKWRFHVYKPGTVTLKLKLEGDNYVYDESKTQCIVKVEPGPALPIEYVGLHDIEDYDGDEESNIKLTVAKNDRSDHTCWLTWCPTDNRNRYMLYLSKYGLNVEEEYYNGNKNISHFHLPSTYEWRSLFPGGCIVWTKTFQDAVETGVAFGVSANFPRSTGENVDDYKHAITTEKTNGWTSDFYSRSDDEPYWDLPEDSLGTAKNGKAIGSTDDPRPSRKCYALRFKGTTYCSAWRYDYIWTMNGTETGSAVRGVEDTHRLTGNYQWRKSLVVRTIYLGPTGSNLTEKDLMELPWDDYEGGGNGTNKVIIRRFPCSGGHASGEAQWINIKATSVLVYDRPHNSWYFSGTPTSDDGYHRSVRLTNQFAQGDQRHKWNTFSIRLFKDYEEWK